MAHEAHWRVCRPADAARWPAALDDTIVAGRFFYAVTFFLTSGVKEGDERLLERNGAIILDR